MIAQCQYVVTASAMAKTHKLWEGAANSQQAEHHVNTNKELLAAACDFPGFLEVEARRRDKFMIDWRATAGLKLPDGDGAAPPVAACGTAASPGMPNPNEWEEQEDCGDVCNEGADTPILPQSPAGTATTEELQRVKQPRAAKAISAGAADVEPATKKQKGNSDAKAVAGAGAPLGESGTPLEESGPAQP